MQEFVLWVCFFAAFVGAPLSICILAAFGVGDRRYAARRAIIWGMVSCIFTSVHLQLRLIFAEQLEFTDATLSLALGVGEIAAVIVIVAAWVHRRRLSRIHQAGQGLDSLEVAS